MRNFVLPLILVLGLSQAVDHKQLNGLKRLMRGLPAGIYPTCSIVFFADIVDYDTAEQRCKNIDMGTGVVSVGNLVTVNDADKNADMQLLLELAYPMTDDMSKWGETSWAWAGLRKTSNTAPKSKKDKKYDLEDWQWADESNPSGYVKWMKKQPDQNSLKNGDKGCNEEPKCFQNQMRVNHHGIWDDTFKFKEHPYACDYQGKYIISPELNTWEQAKEACEDAGLILAKVRSDFEVKEITGVAAFMLGAVDATQKIFHESNWFWIGGNDITEEGVWKWTDGEVVDDWGIPWRSPNPDNAVYALAEGQNAMSVSKWGQFDDSFQTKRKRPFACQCAGT